MRIKEIRKSRNMTQKELANAIGVNYTVISRYEVGAVNPPSNRLEAIAKALDVSVDALFSQEDKTDNKPELEEETYEHGNLEEYKQIDSDRIIYYKFKESKYLIALVKGICELCGNPAPFINTDGIPFLEIHHIKWLSEGGTPTIDNTVALCPNCHRRVHMLNSPYDIEKLKEAAAHH